MHSREESRRRHGAELKAQVLAACDVPGASVAAVARAHELNANLVHKWRRDRSAAVADRALPVTAARVGEFIALSPPSAVTFVASPMSAPSSSSSTEPPSTDIRVEVKRGATMVVVSWPISAAGACAAWLRELVR